MKNNFSESLTQCSNVTQYDKLVSALKEEKITEKKNLI